jgi:uncharacterized protein YjiS (DUF1127 family)
MIVVEAILSASALLHGGAAQSVGRSVVGAFKRWRAAYTAWHRERRAMAELLSMSDRDLRDIGINRCETRMRFLATQRASVLPCATECLRLRYGGTGRDVEASRAHFATWPQQSGHWPD